MPKILFKNDTLSESIMVFCGKEQAIIGCGKDVLFEDIDNDATIKISMDRKSKVSVKWLSFLLTEPVNSDAKSNIYFDYEFKINSSNDMNLIVSENYYRVNDSLKLNSVCVTSERDYICDENYICQDSGKNAKYRHTLMQLLLLSGLPIVLIGIIYLLFQFKVGVLLAIMVVFFVGTVPSLKSINEFNKSIKNANVLLKSTIDERCDYDKIESVANDLIKDNESNGIVKFIAKIIKHLIN